MVVSAPNDPVIPAVKEKSWAKTNINHSVLANWKRKDEARSASGQKGSDPPSHFGPDGLPPTPEEVDAFVADKSSNAYEKVIHRLLDRHVMASAGDVIGWMWHGTPRMMCEAWIPRIAVYAVPRALVHRDW